MSQLSKWSLKDKQNVVEFLNLLAEKAVLNLTVKETIRFYGGLHYFQNELLKKIDDSILEVLSVKEIKKDQ